MRSLWGSIAWVSGSLAVTRDIAFAFFSSAGVRCFSSAGNSTNRRPRLRVLPPPTHNFLFSPPPVRTKDVFAPKTLLRRGRDREARTQAKRERKRLVWRKLSTPNPTLFRPFWLPQRALGRFSPISVRTRDTNDRSIAPQKRTPAGVFYAREGRVVFHNRDTRSRQPIRS